MPPSARLFTWEILHSTIRKMDKHVQKIQQELEGAKDKLEKQQHKRVKLRFTLKPLCTHCDLVYCCTHCDLDYSRVAPKTQQAVQLLYQEN